MPFTTATEADWTEARRITFTACIREGHSAADADDMAQACIMRAITAAERRTFDRPQHATRGIVNFLRRRGLLWRLLPRESTRHKEGSPLPVSDRGSRSLDPAFLAARAEAMQERVSDLGAGGRAYAPVALARVQEASGIGPLAMHEAGTAPYIHGTGEGYTPPASGCRGLHSTDPNPATREAAYDEASADAARVGLALTRSR